MAAIFMARAKRDPTVWRFVSVKMVSLAATALRKFVRGTENAPSTATAMRNVPRANVMLVGKVPDARSRSVLIIATTMASAGILGASVILVGLEKRARCEHAHQTAMALANASTGNADAMTTTLAPITRCEGARPTATSGVCATRNLSLVFALLVSRAKSVRELPAAIVAVSTDVAPWTKVDYQRTANVPLAMLVAYANILVKQNATVMASVG